MNDDETKLVELIKQKVEIIEMIDYLRKFGSKHSDTIILNINHPDKQSKCIKYSDIVKDKDIFEFVQNGILSAYKTRLEWVNIAISRSMVELLKGEYNGIR